MRFRLVQRIDAAPDAVAATFVEPEFYATLTGLPDLGPPEVLSHEVQPDGRVHLRIRYRFTRELSSTVRRVVDPSRLTWVEDSVHDLEARTARFRMEPDHYADRFTASGTSRVTATTAGGCERVTEGDLVVRAPLVGGRVERAIVDGLEQHQKAETGRIEAWVAARSAPPQHDG